MWRNGLDGRCAEDSDVRPPETGGVEEEGDEDANPKSSICCLQGCLAASAVGFSFFVGLPTGILLVVYASKSKDVPLISVGAVLVALPLIMLIIVVILCFNQRRMAQLRKNKINTKKTKTKAAAAAAAVVAVDSASIVTATTTTSASSEGSP